MARTWANALSARGHEVTVYTSLAAARGDAYLSAGITCRPIDKGPRLLAPFLMPCRIRRAIKSDGCEVVLSMLTYSNLVCLMALRCVPANVSLVISERNVPSTYLPLEGRGGLLQRALARRLYRYADASVAISHPVGADLMSAFHVDSRRVFVVPNPVVDTSAVTTSLWPCPERTLVLGFVGRFVDQKQPSRFVDVLGALKAQGQPARGVLYGDGPLREAIVRQAAALGVEVECREWVEPWAADAGDIDCVLLPSSVEGFGNVLVEAAQAGVPCVASSQALGVADAIVPGLTGELALSDRADDLVVAIFRSLREWPAGGISGDDSKARWLNRFSVDGSTELLETVLRRAAGTRTVE